MPQEKWTKVQCPLCNDKRQVWSWPVDNPDDKLKLGCPVCSPEDARDECDHESAYFFRNGARPTCLFCGES